MKQFDSIIREKRIILLGHSICNDKTDLVSYIKNNFKNFSNILVSDGSPLNLYNGEDTLIIYPTYLIFEQSSSDLKKNMHLILITFGSPVFPQDIDSYFFTPTDLNVTYQRDLIRVRKNINREIILRSINTDIHKQILIINTDSMLEIGKFIDVYTKKSINDFNSSKKNSLLVLNSLDKIDVKNIEIIHICIFNIKIIPFILNILSTRNWSGVYPRNLTVYFYLDLNSKKLVENYNNMISSLEQFEKVYKLVKKGKPVIISNGEFMV